MDNFLIVIVIIYFAINVLGRTTKKQPSNEDASSVEYSENMDNKDYDFPNFLEYLDVKPEENRELVEIANEKELESFEPENTVAEEKKTDNFTIRGKKSIKKLNVSKKALKNAIVMAEVLGKPVSMK